jgi:hypothetical protein
MFLRIAQFASLVRTGLLAVSPLLSPGATGLLTGPASISTRRA